MVAPTQPKLSNIQLELLKLFNTDFNSNDLKELKNQLATFYAQKSIQLADNFWVENNLTDEKMEEWLNDKNQ